MTMTVTVKSELQSCVRGMEDDLQKMSAGHATLQRLFEDLSREHQSFDRSLRGSLQSFQGALSPQQQAALRQLQWAIQAYESSYLALQTKISHESRQLATLSNVMKLKHDTAKNAINNIR